MCQHALIAVGLVAFSLGIWMAGYSGFEYLTPLDSFLNTAMLLGGMGLERLGHQTSHGHFPSH
jgi:fatty acid desaturase